MAQDWVPNLRKESLQPLKRGLIVADTFGTVAQKRDYYLQIMQRAQQLNDQILIKLILKKLAHLGMARAVSATSECIIIPFPTVPYSTKCEEYERLPGGRFLN